MGLCLDNMNKIKKIFSSLFEKTEKDEMRDKILSEEIDFGNIVSSSLLAKGIYDELKKGYKQGNRIVSTISSEQRRLQQVTLLKRADLQRIAH